MSLSPVLLPLYDRAGLVTTNIGHYSAQTRGLFDISHHNLFANQRPSIAWLFVLTAAIGLKLGDDQDLLVLPDRTLT